MKQVNILIAAMAVAAIFAVAQSVEATALSDSRDTPQRTGERTSLTMASNVIIYAGSIVCVNSSSKAVPAADTAGYAVIGMAEETVDNRTAVYSATRRVSVRRGVFRWVNADSITNADIASLVYITDDQTVNKTGGGNNIIAGTVVDVDSDGVWVDTGKVGPSGAATPLSLAVAGSATVGTNLTVSGATALNGGLTSDTTKFTVADTSGNTYIDGTLVVKGTVTGSNTVSGTGFKIGAVSGWSGSVTNCAGLTNVVIYSGGVITNVVTTGVAP